jgi:hypothetical protein
MQLMKTLLFEMFFKVNVQVCLNKIIFFGAVWGSRTCQFSSSRFQDGRGVVKLYKMLKHTCAFLQNAHIRASNR